MKLKKLIAGLGVLLSAVSFTPPAMATVSNTGVQTVTAAGNGSNTTFAITFDFRSSSWITVTQYDTSTNPVTVTSIPQGAGAGKFTVSGTNVIMGTAPTSTQSLVIGRNIPLTQPVVFNPASIFPYQGLSSQIDQITLELQDLNAGIGGSNTIIGGSPSVPTGVPYNFLGWDSAGAKLVNYGSTPSTGDVLQFNGSGWGNYSLTPANLINTVNLGSTPIGPGVGGTGVSNSGFLTWGSNALTLTTTGTTNVTLPTSGTLLAGTATNNNIGGTFVKRDSSGNFSSGTISANLTGNVTGNVTGNTSGTSANVTGVVAIGNGGTGQTTQATALTALTGSQSAGYYLRSDGTNSALAPFHIADLGSYDVPRTVLQHDTANTLVLNDALGNMSPLAGVSVGDYVSFNGTTWVDTPAPAGLLAITQLTGDVTAIGPGSATATVVSVGGSTAAKVHSAELAANAATALNTPSTIMARDSSGNVAATTFNGALGGNASSASVAAASDHSITACGANDWATGLSTTWALTCSQPNFSNLSGSVAASQLPNPSPSTLGGIQSLVQTAHQWINSISTAGVPSSSQPAFSDLSGSATFPQLPIPSPSPSSSNKVLTSNGSALVYSSAGSGTVTSVGLIGDGTIFPGSILGTITTSGNINLGSPQNELPNTFLAGPTSGSGQPTFRVMDPSDIPTWSGAGKQYVLSGATAITCPQTGFSVVRAVADVYQTFDGAWRMRFNFTATFTSATITTLVLTFPSTTVFKNVSGFYQSVNATGYFIQSAYKALATYNTASIYINYLTATTDQGIIISGDVELDSQPSWAN